MKNKRKKIIGIVALYAPKPNDIILIEKYVDDLDYCILIDDTGTDNEILFREFLMKHKAEYIYNEYNMGLCASVNKGFERACKIGADWILVMNPDGSFSDGSIRVFREYIERNDTNNVAILCPEYNFDRHPRIAGKGTKSVYYTDMSGSFYNAEVLKKLGYYDINTYFYGLDAEFCLRVKRNGYQIIRCKEAVLNHHPAHTECLKFRNKIIFRYGKDAPDRYYYQFRSGYYIHYKYHDIKQDLFMLYKYLKVLFLFDEKKEYLYCIKKAKQDAKNNYYGKFIKD